jgi:hypothetical protein
MPPPRAPRVGVASSAVRSGAVELDAHRACERSSEDVLGFTDTHRDRPVERLACGHDAVLADRDALFGEVAQHLGVGVRDPHEPSALTHLEAVECLGVAFVDDEVAVRDRVAVRVVRRVAELRRDARLEVLRENVLERLGLLVDAIPRTSRCSAR